MFRSKWILSCATLGLIGFAGAYADAAPKKDPEARAVRREARVEAVGRAILHLPMVEVFPTGRDAFAPRGREISRGNREARDARHEARTIGEADVDLAATVRRGGDAPSVSPIPEPSSVLLLAAGAALVALVARRKIA
ncbi:MAG: PEP-CTERM sorting domain-containing protein [Myxococcota bacterium]